jgi:hypothetical protein
MPTEKQKMPKCSTKTYSQMIDLKLAFFTNSSLYNFVKSTNFDRRSINGYSNNQSIVSIACLDDDARPVLLDNSFVYFQHVAGRDGLVFRLPYVLHESVEIVNEYFAFVLVKSLKESLVIFFHKFSNNVLE